MIPAELGEFHIRPKHFLYRKKTIPGNKEKQHSITINKKLLIINPLYAV